MTISQLKIKKRDPLYSSAESTAEFVKEDIVPFGSPYALHYPFLAFMTDGLLLLAVSLLINSIQTVNLVSSNLISVSSPFAFAIITLVWLTVFAASNLYHYGRYSYVWGELRNIIKNAIVAQLMAIGLLYLLGWQIPQTILIQHLVLSMSFLLSWRLLYHTVSYVSFIGNNKLLRRVLVICSNERVRRIQTVLSHVEPEYVKVIGIVANNPKNFEVTNHLGGFDMDLAALVAKYEVDDVVMSFTHSDKAIAQNALNKVRQLPVKTYVLPEYMEVKLSHQSTKCLDDLNLVNISTPTFNKIDLFLKRSFDIIVSLILLLLAAPVMALVALAIKIESSGPILFVQERMGQGKKKFPIFKFRSMRVGADDELDTVSEYDETGRITNHKRPDDPRVTHIGKFIRKTSLDELPQIFNVLRGEMSIVGPRPELIRLVNEYEPWQDHRFIVKQGITGWWQVNGRSTNPCHLSTHQDVEYINNYSFLLDLQIILMTIPALLKGKGAF
jgi:exopolysaccharide biosynthesis polyprenyl glycosylphosphotransferase